MRYRLLALDLDGTLLQPDHTVSDEDAAAIAEACAAGVTVVPCTGRTLDAACFDPDTAWQLVELLAEVPEAVLVFRDPDRAGHDYLITGKGQLTPNTAWWFEHTKARVHEDRAATAETLTHCVRVAVVSSSPSMQHLVTHVKQTMAGRVETHSFAGVERADGQDPVQILEVFAAGVNKWRGLRRLADDLNLDNAQIAFIGDEVNDLPALKHAGCAVAMGNAIDAVKQAAHHVTKTNTDHGVAHAIHQMLRGNW